MIYVFDKTSFEFLGTRDASTDPTDETTVEPPPYDDINIGYWDAATQTWSLKMRSTVIPARLDTAWTAANVFAESQMDENSRHSIALLLAQNVMSPLPQAQLNRILQYGSWWSSVWAHYATVKAQITAGQDVSFDPSVPGPCPYTIWQLSSST